MNSEGHISLPALQSDLSQQQQVQIHGGRSAARRAMAAGREGLNIVNRYRILIVDDDAMAREILKRILEHAGYERDLNIVVAGYDSRLTPDVWVEPRYVVEVLAASEGHVTGVELIRSHREAREESYRLGVGLVDAVADHERHRCIARASRS